MTKKFLIHVETTEIYDDNGKLIEIIQKPSGLIEDENGKYIMKDGEKIYFEFAKKSE